MSRVLIRGCSIVLTMALLGSSADACGRRGGCRSATSCCSASPNSSYAGQWAILCCENGFWYRRGPLYPNAAEAADHCCQWCDGYRCLVVPWPAGADFIGVPCETCGFQGNVRVGK